MWNEIFKYLRTLNLKKNAGVNLPTLPRKLTEDEVSELETQRGVCRLRVKNFNNSIENSIQVRVEDVQDQQKRVNDVLALLDLDPKPAVSSCM